jgi:hypothetical protein
MMMMMMAALSFWFGIFVLGFLCVFLLEGGYRINFCMIENGLQP